MIRDFDTAMENIIKIYEIIIVRYCPKFARKAIHTIALVCIGKNRNGIPNNTVLNGYYSLKCASKPKMVALVAVMHKVCNIIFAVLRDKKTFKIISPEEHNNQYHNSLSMPA